MTRKAWCFLFLFCLAAVAVSVRNGDAASRGGGGDSAAGTEGGAAEREGEGFLLRPASATVYVGGTVELHLVYCSVIAPSRLVCEGDRHAADVKWEVVDGPGRVRGDTKGALYQAPASKPARNEATVEATVTDNAGKAKTVLHSNIQILEEGTSHTGTFIKIPEEVQSYTGTFTSHFVAVYSEYTEDLAGTIRWDFEEYYEEGDWREYTGSGTAAWTIQRVGCGTPASFSNVPVDGYLRVYKDNRYEFQINLVSDAELTRQCHRPDLDKNLHWEETYFPSSGGMSSADPCGTKEYYPSTTDIKILSFSRNGSCENVINRFQDGWSFTATK